MSVKEVKAFLTALKQKESDESLKEKAASAKTKEERLSFFADTAREMGYDVSEEEIREALVQMQQEDIVALEDDALEDVVGGWKGAPHERRGCPKNNYHPHKWVKTGKTRKGRFIGLIDDVEYRCKYCGQTEWFWR